jgi:NAD(P)-dependent dehydrogenase (short-subunit alcohol dehydrogenase family)
VDKKPVAAVAGVGPGLGLALVDKFTREGMAVAALARDAAGVEALLSQRGVSGARAYGCDVAEAASVAATFAAIEAEMGTPSLVVFNAGAFKAGGILELSAAELERTWRIGCLGGFLVAQEAVKRMIEVGRGTIIFTGATASIRGSARFAALAVPKFGLRALAQSLARELGPKGIHVAHVVVDGGIGQPGFLSTASDQPDATLAPEAIAASYWQLHRQHRSAWTQELDLRPWVERF